MKLLNLNVFLVQVYGVGQSVGSDSTDENLGAELGPHERAADLGRFFLHSVDWTRLYGYLITP